MVSPHINFERWIDPANATLQLLSDNLHASKSVEAHVLRLDLLHPIISGNKWYKLKYTLEKVHKENYTGIITAGGAFSNHLHATVAAGQELNIPVVAMVRGEEPSQLSPTLRDLVDMGTELHFMSREDYRSESIKQRWAATHYPNYLYIPEGGASEEGLQGAASILQDHVLSEFDYILGAMGTGTMMAGILRSAKPHQKIIGIPVLKISDLANNTLASLMQAQSSHATYQIYYEYHRKGYAKIDPDMIDFMNTFYQKTGIPLDCVYTAKLFMAYYDLLSKGLFAPNSRVLLIHSGGLQGNRSIADQLMY